MLGWGTKKIRAGVGKSIICGESSMQLGFSNIITLGKGHNLEVPIPSSAITETETRGQRLHIARPSPSLPLHLFPPAIRHLSYNLTSFLPISPHFSLLLTSLSTKINKRPHSTITTRTPARISELTRSRQPQFWGHKQFPQAQHFNLALLTSVNT
ncbi:hypothetical protein V496_05147 [Pseudogymnoascus sp. VKM F-4515 (FW-2607)]|nr:hypothetical protein V496_05147 [Pseudogymnoascus sp. VKM F-4515 (FW-2607)]